MQPFNDAIKLFTKETSSPLKRNCAIFFYSPVFAITFRLLIWITYPSFGGLSQSFSLIIVYIVIRINVYPLMLSGWSSNSNYAILGRLRGVAQTISYEISLALILIFFLLLISRLSLYISTVSLSFYSKFFVFFPLSIVWLISCVAETNRTPFDFAEGESELVSGFNIEYGSGGFALIFIAEYASIYFIGRLFTLLFFSSKVGSIFFPLMTRGLVFVWVWLRSTLPRYRYDILIGLAWFTFLPSSLLTLFFVLSMIF